MWVPSWSSTSCCIARPGSLNCLPRLYRRARRLCPFLLAQNPSRAVVGLACRMVCCGAVAVWPSVPSRRSIENPGRRRERPRVRVGGPADECGRGAGGEPRGGRLRSESVAPEDLCRCLPTVAVRHRFGGRWRHVWVDKPDYYVQGPKFSSRYADARPAERQARRWSTISRRDMTNGVGTRRCASRLQARRDAESGVFIEGDLTTAAASSKTLICGHQRGDRNTSGTTPRVATCRQARSELTAVSAMLASLDRRRRRERSS